MVDGVSNDNNNQIRIKLNGTEKSISLDKLKGLKLKPIFDNLKMDINGDGKIDEKDRIDTNANGTIDTDVENDLMQKFLLNISGENHEISQEVFPETDIAVNKEYFAALEDLAEQQTAAEESETTTNTRNTTLKVKPGWGNLQITKEALKAQGIENPTSEQIQKARTAIEDANPEQVKVWQKDNNPNIPKGTKYFYANAEIKIPDLKAVLGIETAEPVEDVADVKEVTNPDELTPIPETSTQPQVEEPQETDCVISKPTKQSKKTNDCWLLSGTNALLNTTWGRRAINESIQKDSSGNVTVTLKGADNKQIHITKAEIEEAKASGLYSEGDDNMIALEIAINKYKEELHPQTASEREINGLSINWGEGYELFHLITGKEVKRASNRVEAFGYSHPDYVKKGLDIEKALDTMRDNPDEVAMVVSFSNPSNLLSKINADGVELSPKHAYSVSRVEKDETGKEYVILVNPRNSGEEIKISKEEFLKYLDAADAIAQNDDSLQTKAPTPLKFPPLS